MAIYRDAAPVYRSLGWIGVLPLPPGKKSAPPTGYTGWNSQDPSEKMVEAWRNESTGFYQASSNICIHMPDGVIGIDIDHYGEKTGDLTLARLETELGPLPASYTSTSRPGTPSGIRWFRVEPGLRWPTGPGKDIEFIHRGHRYAIVWPSVHPDTGDQYQWFDHSGQPAGPPSDDELAWLPDEWQVRFTGGEMYTEQPLYRQPTEEEQAHCLTEGDICRAMAAAIRGYQEGKTVQARHDSMVKSVMRVVRLGEQGHRGAQTGIQALRVLFTSDVGPDRKDGSEESEFARAVAGAIAKTCQAPTPEHQRGCCGSESRQARATNLPPEFWNSRPSLDHIRRAAHYRGRSADVVLYSVMARISAMVSPFLKFENRIDPKGSLNFFVAVAGPSGTGKSTAVRIANDLVVVPPFLSIPGQFRDGNGLGSGEGLAELYMGWEYVEDIERGAKKDGTYYTKRERIKKRSNAFLYVDEGQSLTQQSQRKGATINPTLRSAWSAATLGQANGQEETTRDVPAHSYSMGLVIAFQRNTAQDILADVEAGTPQRFLWCSSIDETVPDVDGEWPGPLSIDLQSGTLGIRDSVITFHNEINTELRKYNHGKVTGKITETDHMDSQMPLMLCKLAAHLCLLDGRSVVSVEDWELAKLMYATSKAVIDELLEYGRDVQEAKDAAFADRYANREARAHLAKAGAPRRIQRIAVNIYKHASEAVYTIPEHRKLIAHRDRPFFDDALDHCLDQNWLSVVDGKVQVGVVKPTEE